MNEGIDQQLEERYGHILTSSVEIQQQYHSLEQLGKIVTREYFEHMYQLHLVIATKHINCSHLLVSHPEHTLLLEKAITSCGEILPQTPLPTSSLLPTEFVYALTYIFYLHHLDQRYSTYCSYLSTLLETIDLGEVDQNIKQEVLQQICCIIPQVVRLHNVEHGEMLCKKLQLLFKNTLYAPLTKELQHFKALAWFQEKRD